jgi:hypothetical protein
MDYGQLIKDIFTLNFSSMGTRWAKLSGRVMRKLHGEKIDEVPVKKIPVIINNRNRYTYLIKLIEWLEDAGMENIIILDNDSTYPKLLEYYDITKHRVVRLGENVGHLALWKSTVYDEFKWQHYIYTDPDVVPVASCPKDMPEYLLKQLKKYPSIEKIGLGLKIDDLPDHYRNKKEVIEWEKQFWKKIVERGIYDAGVDTTFALYRPYTNGAKWVAPAYRTDEPYMAHHMPWYENTADPGEENLYYMKHARQGASHWTNKTT